MAKTNKTAGRSSDPLDTPVMRQYLDLKKAHPDSILLFRMGDFYELFLDDAKEAAPIMDVSLTARQGDVPMAGVPYHSADTYIARLLDTGKKVAVAEQEIDPENPKLMRRRIRRILSPGALVEEAFLGGASHNYLMAIAIIQGQTGIALADVSTGDFFSLDPGSPGKASVGSDDSDTVRENDFLKERIRDVCAKYGPGEILVHREDHSLIKQILGEAKIAVVPREGWMASPLEGARRLEEKYGVQLKGLGYDSETSPALGAVSLILHYIKESFPDAELDLTAPVMRHMSGEYMSLGEETIRNLDLISNQTEGGSDRTLFRVLDHCRTAPGKRFLKESLLSPLMDKEKILSRQNGVEFFVRTQTALYELQDILKQTGDLERIVGRILSGRGTPADFAQIRDTLHGAINLSRFLSTHEDLPPALQNIPQIDQKLLELLEELDRIVEEAPSVNMGARPFVKPGINTQLDEARMAAEEGVKWMAELERRERERTGISTLRVKYNRVVGYFIEVSKGQSANAPEDYVRRQTLVGAERFTMPELSELEQKILGADETIEKVEKEYFEVLTGQTVRCASDLRRVMKEVAFIDVMASFATCALRHNWSRPGFARKRELIIDEGRHPVVERYLPAGESFIGNSLVMDGEDRHFAVITGPNMAGKSTYIRQTALIQILFQIGSYVPAKKANLSIADNVFTRIGAGDNLTRGESTFFVEMLETARILGRCTENSLVIMDEVGRGTSTYDGLSIAWGIVEYLSGYPGKRARTLFATHYHELTELESRTGVFNLTMDVREIDGKVVFLRKVRDGAADDSYGIHVAKLAGIPEEVLARAGEKLAELESGRNSSFADTPTEEVRDGEEPLEYPDPKEQKLPPRGEGKPKSKSVFRVSSDQPDLF